MQTITNASGSNDLFEVDGGPGQKRWMCLRIEVDPTANGGGSCEVRVNGVQRTNGGLSIIVASTTGVKTSGFQHMLVTTGDVVSLFLSSGATANLIWSANTDTEEF